jgi:hypothetical protein
MGSAYIAGATILQDDEGIDLLYDYPLNNHISLLSSSDYILISNQGSNELNKLQRLNFLVGGRINFTDKLFFDLLGGIEDNRQMTIESKGSIFKLNGILTETDVEGYLISGNTKGEILSLDLARVNQNFQINTYLSRQYDESSSISANISYKMLDRYNALRREQQYIRDNNLNFDYSLEARYNNMVVSDVNLSFGLSDDLVGIVRLYFANNSTSRSFKDYVEKDPRTAIRQTRDQLRVTINPEFNYITDKIKQLFGFQYSFESDINSVSQINSIAEQEYNLYRTRAYDLDNITSNFRLISRTTANISSKDTFYLSGISSITRFDTPSENNNSDRDEFLGLVSIGYGRNLSEILTFRLDAELQFNHQVNLKASRSSSNYWMRSIKFAPSIIIQTKNFFMRPQPYVLANYTVYDFEGFAPGVKSFSLRQIGYNDSLALIVSKNIYLGTRIDLIYKETGTLLWSDFKESPVNGNLKLFFKLYAGYFDSNYNIAIGARYFNLTQKNFRLSTFVNSDYKTESFAPEVVITADILNFATLKLNGWYEFQIINDINTNEIPNIIFNTIIKL